MKAKDLVKNVKLEILEEKSEKLRNLIRERLLEIQESKQILEIMERDFNELMETDVDDFILP